MKKLSRAVVLACLCAMMAACSSSQHQRSTSTAEPHYKVGQPYEVNGTTYTPQEDYSYDQTGVASWYGQDFHGGQTANGEVFNKDELTAAHKTLPLPTLARVTNLDNGRSIVVRINDRGPFSGARLIDVSQRAAQLLGFEQQGTAKVRVQVLADESKAIADAMRHYGSPVAVASAAPVAQPESQPATQGAPVAAVETETLAPIRTTPEVHQQLLATQPVAEVVQVPVVGARQLYVQAGSFTVLANAQRLEQSLSRYGKVTIADVKVNGTLFHRVRVGPLKDVPTADQTLASVRATGVTAARTIVD